MKQNLTEHNTLSTNALKICAIIAMVCDHIPYLFGNWQEVYYTHPWVWMHAAGRVTAPIFFYLLAIGYRRTRNADRYTLRLLVFALISYVPYIWYFKSASLDPDGLLGLSQANFLQLNVIFTMLFGLLMLRAIHEVRNKALKVVLIVLCLAGGYWCDYGLYGLAMILICDLVRGSRRDLILGMGAAMMIYLYMRTSGWFPGGVSPFESLEKLVNTEWMVGSLTVLLCQLIPLALIAKHRAWAAGFPPEAKPGFWAKWGFYIFYPAHIIVFLLISRYISG